MTHDRALNPWQELFRPWRQPLTKVMASRYTETDSVSDTKLGEHMTTVAFTDEFYPDSSAVDEAFYDENTQTVYIDLHNTMYAYAGVDKVKWERFKKSGDGNGSVGSFYAGSIKRSHGPGTNLGLVRDIEYKKVSVSAPRVGVGAPQALRTPAATPAAAPTYYGLSVPATATNGKSRFEVKFSVGTASAAKSHEVWANDEADALALLSDLGKVFGATLKVRSVTHYFE